MIRNRNVLLTLGAVAVILGIVGFAAFHGSSLALLNPSGSIGLQERTVILVTLLLSGIIVVPVFLMLFLFAWKYRADDAHAAERHAPEWDHDSWWTDELVWWIVPSVIVFTLSIVTWQSSHALDPYKPIVSGNPPITVQVVALDWKWLFIYPDQGIATVNMLEIPADTPVHFELTADAPMNSFWIPKLGGQIMAMPGMMTQLYLMANGEGTYTGMSANISGAGFAGMTFVAKSVSKDTFNAWVQSQKDGPTLTADAYASLTKPTSYVPPTHYALANSNLYTSVIMSYLVPTITAGMDFSEMTKAIGSASLPTIPTLQP